MNTSNKNATTEKLLNGNESNINMNMIRNEANLNNNNNADDEDEPRTKLVDKRRMTLLKSKKWIILLILLCLILFFGLIISFIKNSQCNNEKNNKEDTNSDYNLISDLNKNVNNKQQSKPQSKWADEVLDNNLNNYWNESRLPSNLIPSHYDINLRINVNDRYFIGSCSIQFYCLKSIRFLVLHSDTNIMLNGLPKIYKTTRKNITFEDDNKIIDSTIQQLKVKGIKTNAFYQYIIVELADNYEFEANNNYTVFIENFSSKIGNNLKGIYYSTYNQKNATK